MSRCVVLKKSIMEGVSSSETEDEVEDSSGAVQDISESLVIDFLRENGHNSIADSLKDLSGRSVPSLCGLRLGDLAHYFKILEPQSGGAPEPEQEPSTQSKVRESRLLFYGQPSSISSQLEFMSL